MRNMKARIYGIKNAEEKEIVKGLLEKYCELDDVTAKAERSRKHNKLIKVNVYHKGSKALYMVIQFLPSAKIEFYHRKKIVKTIKM